MSVVQAPTQFIIITGLSGSGKSGAMKCFEDLGFFCVDNLPSKLIPTFVELCTRKGEEIRNVALIIDIREGEFLHVSTREDVEIGNRVFIKNGAVIGTEGFGFARQEDGQHYKIIQTGRIIVEDDVEIGANTCIDRPAIGETRIRKGVKIDNLVQIGHVDKQENQYTNQYCFPLLLTFEFLDSTNNLPNVVHLALLVASLELFGRHSDLQKNLHADLAGCVPHDKGVSAAKQ